VFAVICVLLCVVQLASIALAWWRCKAVCTCIIPPMSPPGITLVQTLKGVESHSQATLQSCFRLSYSTHEVLFCVADPDDPVIPLVEAAISAYPDVSARLLIGQKLISDNPKLNNMAKGWDAGRHDLICFTDSNLLLPPDYLQRVLATWSRWGGVASAPPIGVDPVTLWDEIECAFLNTCQARWQYAADTLGFGFSQGKTMFFDRRLLGAQGLSALASQPAEDAALTKIARSSRRRVHLVAPPFAQPIAGRTLADVWLRQLRWARLRRKMHPWLHAPELIGGVGPPTLAFALSLGDADLAITRAAICAAFAIAWFAPEIALARWAGWPLSPRALLALILRDLTMPVLWCAAWAGSDFSWRGSMLDTSAVKTSRKRPNLSARHP
jgi:ceramide glucosyltransferase